MVLLQTFKAAKTTMKTMKNNLKEVDIFFECRGGKQNMINRRRCYLTCLIIVIIDLKGKTDKKYMFLNPFLHFVLNFYCC